MNLEIDHHAVVLIVGELHGCGLAVLAYILKNMKKLFCGVFVLIYEICTNENHHEAMLSSM